MLFGEELGYATPDSDHYRALNNSLVVEVNVAQRTNTFAVKKCLYDFFLKFIVNK